MRPATPISLSATECDQLQDWAGAAPDVELRQRAMIILLAAEGNATRDIADRLGLSAKTVSKWRTRFSREGLVGLRDASRSGRPRWKGDDIEQHVLELVRQGAADGRQWTAASLAEALGSVSETYVRQLLARLGIRLDEQVEWRKTLPAASPKVVDLVAMYLSPAADAAVVAATELPLQHQAYDLGGWTRLPRGCAPQVRGDLIPMTLSKLLAQRPCRDGRDRLGEEASPHRAVSRGLVHFLESIAAEQPANTALHVLIRDGHTDERSIYHKWARRSKALTLQWTRSNTCWLAQLELLLALLWKRDANGETPRQLHEVISSRLRSRGEHSPPIEWVRSPLSSVVREGSQ